MVKKKIKDIYAETFLLRLEDVVLPYFKYGSNKCLIEVVMDITVL